MYDPAVDLVLRAVIAKEPYEKISEKITSGLLPYIDELTRERRFTVLQQAIGQCTKCGLCKEPFAKAMPEGNTYAEIMLIGEAGGEQEVLQSRPFVGPAGQLLDRMLKAAAEKIDIRFNRKNLYITNVVKGRPVEDNKNRPPSDKEKIACYNFLTQEIELVKPKLVLCLGSVAGETVISPDFKISRDIGKFYGDKMKMVAMYHPSYLLHLKDDSPEQIKAKQDCWKVLESIDHYFKEIEKEEEPKETN